MVRYGTDGEMFDVHPIRKGHMMYHILYASNVRGKA